ncbi:MAG: hypothetical protein Q8O09_04645 [Bacillota bacterium]|nr:hypothetical protein [Bacillota bacterium]
MKRIALLVLSIAFLSIGILGLVGVGFFKSSEVLEIIEIVLGGGGLLIAFGKWR